MVHHTATFRLRPQISLTAFLIEAVTEIVSVVGWGGIFKDAAITISASLGGKPQYRGGSEGCDSQPNQ